MKILIIEDDEHILSLLERGFREYQYIVEVAANGDDGEYMASTNHYDVIVLDWMLPSKNGLEILLELRKKEIKTPIIMLTAKADIDDRVAGLQNGADDYLPKPFSFKELRARVEALYRRTVSNGNNTIKVQNLIIDLDTKSVKKDTMELFLSLKEYELLLFLIKNKNILVSNAMIEEQLWREEEYINSNVIQVTIYNLRKKIGKDLIKSFRGLGYRIEV
jgi:DNA-binding response OmpR family regulator